MVVKRDGAIYFTDTYGGLRLRDKDPRKELEFNAVFMWKNGKLTLLIKDMPSTNGLAFSPDEKYLYVNGSRDNYVRRYEVLLDGTLANGKMFIDLSKEAERGITDGLRVDVKGNLYETGPGGVWIISPEGKHLGTSGARRCRIGSACRQDLSSRLAPASTIRVSTGIENLPWIGPRGNLSYSSQACCGGRRRRAPAINHVRRRAAHRRRGRRAVENGLHGEVALHASAAAARSNPRATHRSARP